MTPAKKAAAKPGPADSVAKDNDSNVADGNNLDVAEGNDLEDESDDPWEGRESGHDRLDRIANSVGHDANGNAIRELIELLRELGGNDLGRRTQDVRNELGLDDNVEVTEDHWKQYRENQ